MAPTTPSKSRSAARTKDSVIDSPTLDSRLATSLEATLLLDGDDSGLLDDFSSGVHGLDLMDTPPVMRAGTSGKAKGRVARPSWGPSAAVIGSAQGCMRLLEGIVDESGSTDTQEAAAAATASSFNATTTTGRRLGGMAPVAGAGKARSRYSLFARPAYAAESATAASQPIDAADDSLALAEGDESFLLPSAPAAAPQDQQPMTASVGASEESTAPDKAESREETERQLKELRAMNEAFEAHEEMLKGTVGQIEAFAARIGETDALLDIYIDLLRQTEQRKQLILDPNWRGATEDAESHALSLRLAEQETARLKQQAEAEAAERAAALARTQEKARQAAAATAAAHGGATRGAARGARGTVTRGTTTTTRGAAPSARGRGTTSTTGITTRGTGIARARGSTVGTSSTRGASSTSSGYGAVRSSGYGPPAR